MNKEERKQRFALSILVSSFVFVVITAALILGALIVYFLL